MADQQSANILLERPFSNIGIAFSGGGFRAATFALGTLGYLERVKISDKPLNENISFISSVSGGTITNLLYTSYLHQGKSFASFHKKMQKELNGSNLLQEALMILNTNSEWKSSNQQKQRTLINAFAKAYDRLLFDQETLNVYWNKKNVKKYEVCFNATEFYRGLNFRFQTDGTNNGNQLIGNNYLYFDNKKLETFRKIKLGDVLAASSCFPIGFEPIVYPSDYSYQQSNGNTLGIDELAEAVKYENYNEETHVLSEEHYSEIKDDPKQKTYIRSFGLMDGGITDNQGLKSLMLADKKRRNRVKPDPFDLIIVTDVASYFMDNYEVPVIDNGKLKLNITDYVKQAQKIVKDISIIQWLLAAASLIFIVSGILIDNNWIRIPATVLASILVTLLTTSIIIKGSKTGKYLFKLITNFDLLNFINSFAHLDKFFSVNITGKLVDYLSKTRLNVLDQMLRARITSVMTMVSDVNLKQVRRLIYEMFYNDSCWENRRMPNFIYELSTHNINSRTNRINSKGRLKWTATAKDKILLLNDYDKINAVAEEARLMGTTLWFEDQEVTDGKFRKLVATGQFTTCVNLLEYIISLERKAVPFDKEAKAVLETVRKQLEYDLNLFKNDPFFLYDEMNDLIVSRVY